MEQSLWVEEVLGGGAPGKNPVKCLVEVVKDANSFFAQGFAKHASHARLIPSLLLSNLEVAQAELRDARVERKEDGN